MKQLKQLKQLTKRLMNQHIVMKKLNMEIATSKNNKGMTMVEVIMGFVVLMIFLAGMSGIIAFSSNMLFESMDMRRSQETLQSQVYKTNPGGQAISGTFELINNDTSEKVSLTHMGLMMLDSQSVAGVDEEVLNVRIYGFESDL